jgi:plasmid segregation protein ParM
MLEGEGIIKVVNHLADQIQQKVGVGLTSHIAKSLLENKSITIYGKERSLEKIIAKLSSSYSERLFSILEQRCREELRSVDGIIIGGGGAYYVRDSIPKRLRNLVEIAEEPEFANARGFYKFLRAKGGKNENTDQQRVGEDYKEPEATV